ERAHAVARSAAGRGDVGPRLLVVVRLHLDVAAVVEAPRPAAEHVAAAAPAARRVDEVLVDVALQRDAAGERRQVGAKTGLARLPRVVSARPVGEARVALAIGERVDAVVADAAEPTAVARVGALR